LISSTYRARALPQSRSEGGFDAASGAMAQKQEKNTNEKYIIVTDGGGEDFRYHLASSRVWEEFQKQLAENEEYSITVSLDILIDRLFGYTEYDRMINEEDVDSEILLFQECKDVFAWCYENNVKIVGGRN
jgi:hypothetical protein